MSEADTGTKSYPYISTNVWGELRRRFQKTLPTKVTASYLMSVLGYNTEKAAKNLIPQLRTVGLIDAEGVPQDLAKRYRMDAEYVDAVKEIVDSVYPAELRELFPGPSENVSEVTNWFMRETGGGQASSGTQARFYLSLVSGELPSAERSKSASDNGGGTASTKKTTSTKPAKPKGKTAKAAEPEGGQNAATLSGKSDRSQPNLHIDVQVHISADASTKQIDSVFASMAKHLYGTA